jgi:hypothetical protein
VEKLSSEIGQIFKGILLRNGEMPRVLTLLSISTSAELDRLFEIGIDAVHKEKDKKDQPTGLNQEIINRLEGLEPQY